MGLEFLLVKLDLDSSQTLLHGMKLGKLEFV